MKPIFYVFILFFWWGINILSAQHGNKYMTNFSSSDYKASDQNWGSVQDKNGLQFFANLNGVLIYNGKTWQTITLPNEENFQTLLPIKNFGL